MTDLLFNSALLVEDEPQLASTLKVAFRKMGIPLSYASTLASAKKFIETHPPEFILLDRTLPDGDGLELCAELRTQHYSGSILILTASGRIEDRVRGLNSGADDYLPKPFSWQELEARVRALSRRQFHFQGGEAVKRDSSLTASQDPLWNLDESRLKVRGPKGWIQLTPLEFKLASRLIQRQGIIISRDELLKDVWGFTLMPKTRTVDHFLGRLRKYFEQDPENPIHFLTIRGAGYMFKN